MNQDHKEKIVFFCITIGIFLPIRFTFYSFVSTWWLGSFGVISGVTVLLLYLTKKEKLGWLGRLWKRQILRISKGKLGIIGIGQSLFAITMLSSIVFITDMNDGTPNEDLMRELYADQGITDLSSLVMEYGNLEWQELLVYENWIELQKELEKNPEMLEVALGGGYAIIDEFTGGFHQHFNIVFLVEEIEALCFIIYFRYFYKAKEGEIDLPRMS